MQEHRLLEPLDGRVILIVQRRWLLARQVSAALNEKGARTLLANSARPGQALADVSDLFAAVVDGDCPGLCRTLKAKGVPYVLYTGYEQVGDGANNTVVRKPANAEEIVAAVEQLRYTHI